MKRWNPFWFAPRMRFLMSALPACVVLTLSLLAAPAAGQVIYATGFEDPPFAKHSLLVGQDGWIAPPPLSPNAAVVAQGKRTEGKQALRVRGRDLEHQDFINELTGGYYDAIGSYRRPVGYDTQGTQTVRVSADVYVSGEQTADGNNFFSASVATRTAQTDGNTAGTGELAISSDGHVYGYSGNEFVPTFLTSARVRLNRWHNLAVEVNIGERTYSFFVDGEFLGTFDFDVLADPEDPTIDYTTVLTRGSLITYAAPDTATLKKKAYTAYYDEFSIEVVEGGEQDDGDHEDKGDKGPSKNSQSKP